MSHKGNGDDVDFDDGDDYDNDNVNDKIAQDENVILFSLSQSQKDPATVDKIMKDLDANGDGQVSFEEFVSLVVGLSIACEQCYQMHLKKTGAKK